MNSQWYFATLIIGGVLFNLCLSITLLHSQITRHTAIDWAPFILGCVFFVSIIVLYMLHFKIASLRYWILPCLLNLAHTSEARITYKSIQDSTNDLIASLSLVDNMPYFGCLSVRGGMSIILIILSLTGSIVGTLWEHCFRQEPSGRGLFWFAAALSFFSSWLGLGSIGRISLIVEKRL